MRDIDNSPADGVIAKAIISLAHSLALKGITEGVETPEQLRFLQQHECDEMQRFPFSKPLPAQELEQLLFKAYR